MAFNHALINRVKRLKRERKKVKTVERPHGSNGVVLVGAGEVLDTSNLKSSSEVAREYFERQEAYQKMQKPCR